MVARCAVTNRKSPVVGMVERSTHKRKGRVVALATNDVTAKNLAGIAHEYILPSSTVFTDEFTSYDSLGSRFRNHKRIKHSAGVYVVGDVHTNTIEGFWSLVKRGIAASTIRFRRSTCSPTWMNFRSGTTGGITGT